MNGNAPQSSPRFRPGLKFSSRQRSAILIKAQEFNKPNISYNFVITAQEAKKNK